MTATANMEQPDTRANRLPWLAIIAGATAGAIAFALCALWIGPPAGIVIALVSTLTALARRHAASAIEFVAAGTLCAPALRPSTALVLLGALTYGVGLAIAPRRARRAELLA